MHVFELEVKVFLKRTIEKRNVQEKIARFISSYMALNEKFLEVHESSDYKGYCFDSLKPISKIYEKEKNYDFRIRSIDNELTNYFLEGLENFSNEDFKALTIKVKKISKKHIAKLYSLSPVLVKDDGYWKLNEDFELFERKINENAFKKYKKFIKEDLKEEKFYTNLKFTNKVPIGTHYKTVTLLGDKVELEIKGDSISQDIAYMLIGTGLAEGNGIGFGFVGYKYI